MNVLGAADVQTAFEKMQLPFRFDRDELLALTATSIVDPGPGFLGFPTPRANQGLNLLNLRNIVGVDPLRQPAFFDHPWYLSEPFGHSNCAPGWHFIQTEPEPDSISKPIDYYNSLMSRGLTLASAVEVVLMLFLYYTTSGAQLLRTKHTWCSDQASLGRTVTVGAFGRNGVFISAHPPTYYSRGLGICGKLTQPQTDAISR